MLREMTGAVPNDVISTKMYTESPIVYFQGNTYNFPLNT